MFTCPTSSMCNGNWECDQTEFGVHLDRWGMSFLILEKKAVIKHNYILFCHYTASSNSNVCGPGSQTENAGIGMTSLANACIGKVNALQQHEAGFTIIMYSGLYQYWRRKRAKGLFLHHNIAIQCNTCIVNLAYWINDCIFMRIPSLIQYGWWTTFLNSTKSFVVMI